MRSRLLTFAVLGAILILLGEWSLRSGKLSPLQSLNDFWLEFCIGFASDKIAAPSVTVVRINDDYEPLSIGDDTPAAADGRLSRLDFATILGFLGKLNPKSVAFLPTPSFDENLVLNQTDIVPLKDAAMQLPRFLVAANVSNDGEQAKETAPLPYPELKVEGNADSILEFTRSVRKPDAQLLPNADPAVKAIESARELSDKKTTRVPLVARYQGKVVPSIVLAAAAEFAGVPFDQITVDLSGKSPVVRLGEVMTVPMEADGTFVVPAHSGLSPKMSSHLFDEEKGEYEDIHHFTSLTVDELAYTGEEDDELAKRILANFQSKFDSIARNLVVIGFDRTADRRFTLANGEVLSETMLLSRAIATIQSGRFVDWWPNWARWIAIAAIVILAGILFRFRGGKFFVGWFLSALAFFTALVLIFRTTLTWTPPFFAFALFLAILLVGLAIPLSKKGSGTDSEFDPA